MAAKMDKVNMSLDDIIKTDKRQFRINKFSKGGFGNSNGNNGNVGNKNNQQRRGGGNRGNRNKNNNNNNRLGLLNRSKVIKKRRSNNNNNNGNFNGNQQGNGRRFGGNYNRNPARQVGNVNKNGISRRRFTNQTQKLYNRLGNRPVQHQKQQQQITGSKSNQIIKRNVGSTSIQARIQQRQQKLQQQRGGVAGRPRLARNATGALVVRNKIALQKARKNVQKAKRLLATRQTQMKQLLSRNSTAKKPISIKLKRSSAAAIRQNSKTVRINIANKLKQPRPQRSLQAKKFVRPILKRNRQNQAGANRMVLY